MGPINKVSKGLHTDSSFQYQPKESYRFALNAVQETEVGDAGSISNEQSNEICASFPVGYTPLGKVYIGDGETVVCLVKDDETASEIGILDDACVYTTHMNDLDTANEKLDFRLDKKIQLTYRLRRGCERTIYFVDGNKPPRYFNFEAIEEFKTGGDYDAEKFKLFKTFNDIPEFNNIEIVEGGVLPSGSYNFSIQYLDEDLNPTEWISTTDTVIIYNDTTGSRLFSEIRGSTNAKTIYQDFGITGKAISMEISNLNDSFPFYRIAVIEANNGSGQVSNVLYSSEQSTGNPTFVYTGEVGDYTKGTLNEISAFNTILEKVDHIEQVENRLVLSNVEGKKVNFCGLQKYASRITADISYDNIKLDSISSKSNPKRGEVHTENVGYMPGEIYSFGIVYVFKDGTSSPVFHIPGKATGAVSDMDSDNMLDNTFYVDNDSCDSNDYWGVNSQGVSLKDSNVRHHRFPRRSVVEKPLLTKEDLGGGGDTPGVNYELRVDITGVIDIGETRDPIYYRAIFSRDGYAPLYSYNSIDVTTYRAGEVGGINPAFQDILIFTDPGVLSGFVVEELTPSGYAEPIDLDYNLRVINGSTGFSAVDSEYTSDIFGITFNNIDKPETVDTLGEDVVGYYIVRNSRETHNRTVLDTGVMLPLIEEVVGGTDKFVSHGHLMPDSNRKKEDVFALIHPEHKFNGEELKNTTEYLQEGQYTVSSQNYSTLLTQDVMPGTSYDSSVNTRREKDSDGFTLNNSLRNSNVDYSTVSPTVLATGGEIVETFYLDTLFNKTITDTDLNRKNIYNLSADNKIGIVHLDKKLNLAAFNDKLPYVIMKRNLSNPYANFRNSVYYKEHTNPIAFSSDTGNTSEEIYNGDSYISSMKYLSTMFYSIKMRKRDSKSGLFNFILGGLAIIAGVLITVGTLGLGAPIGIAAIGFGTTQLSTGFKKEQLAKVYGDLYDQGLEDTVDDNYTSGVFNTGDSQEDDEIQWFQDSISDLWFESNVNMNWRVGNTVGLTDFINSPTGYNTEAFKSYALEKVTVLDSKADGGRTYQGFSKAELYEVNKDFTRRDKQKGYFALGLEYDCCSECNEEFPHRIHYSEQSFQEELTDNYRVFLPNNYRDIEGETGVITNMFRIQNNLYIHTEEALWHLPQNIQERVTGDIVSFIGTGSFFELPPRKIVDDQNGHSAGTKSKWGMIKTPYGVFFPNERQASFYLFTGNKIDSLSTSDNFNWFKNNMKLLGEDGHFISTYDSRKERVLFTKNDKISEVLDNSWTMSYSLKTNTWASWHSYIPDFYMQTPNKFYTWKKGDEKIWKHNTIGSYQNFYGVKYPHIIEYVGISQTLETKVWEHIKLFTEAQKYNPIMEEFFEERFITFNKAVIYNARQCTGEMGLIVKDTQDNEEDYLSQQIVNQVGNNILIDKNERDWSLNDIRDIRVDYESPIWDTNIDSLQENYYIDKKLNTASLDENKSWEQLESLRGKYLVVRLIFDTFDDVKLIFNYSVQNEVSSER